VEPNLIKKFLKKIKKYKEYLKIIINIIGKKDFDFK